MGVALRSERVAQHGEELAGSLSPEHSCECNMHGQVGAEFDTRACRRVAEAA